MSPRDLLRASIVTAFGKIPVADRPWNDRVADALMADERFIASLRTFVVDEMDQGIPPFT